MACEFNGQSLQEGKKTFHSITTDHISFVEGGMSLLSTENIYEKFIKTTEEDATVRITKGVGEGLTNRLTPRIEAINGAQWLMSPLPDPVGKIPTMMMWDVAARHYIEAAWDKNDVRFGSLVSDTLIRGQFDEERTKILGGEASDYTPIEALGYLATQYNLGEYTVKDTDDAENANYKAVRTTLIKLIQTSLSGCLSWSMPFDFIFGGGDSECTVQDTANFELRIFDELSAKKDKRRLVMAGAPKFTFVPKHPWGTKYAGNMPDNGVVGAYAPLEAGGEENPKNLVSAELDVSFNPNTGKAEAGTKQMLAKMVTPLSKVRINPAPLDIDGAAPEVFQKDGANDTTYFASGYAIPLSVHQSNPHLFSPTLDETGTGCSSNKKARVLVINRSQRSFPIGRVVLLQNINDEWIPIDFGDDKDDTGSLKTGKWGFQYLVADGDSYFKDDRYYYEEQYQPELSSSVTTSQYESMFRSNFYSSISSLLKQEGVYDSKAGSFIDSANRGDYLIYNSTVGPEATEGCEEPTEGETSDALTGVPAIEALNGAWVKSTSYKADPKCYEASDNCQYADEIEDLLDPNSNTFGNSIEAYVAGLPSGVAVLDSQPGYSNFSDHQYPTEVYTKTEEEKRSIAGALPQYFFPYGEPVSVPPMGSEINIRNCSLMVTERQTQCEWSWWPHGGTTRNCKDRAVDYAMNDVAMLSFIKALRDQLRAICTSEEAEAPQIISHTWAKSSVSKKFVGSRRYLNVTSFDMLSSHWNGNSPVDWLSRTNPSVSYDGGVIDDPSDQKFNLFSPFWGAVFTDGYTPESVKAFLAKRSAGAATAKAVSTHGNGLDAGWLYDEYLHDGAKAPGIGTVKTYARTINGSPASLDHILTWGDSLNFANLPADIGTNASPSGINGTPIPDFHRMINLVNVENFGNYDPLLTDEPPSPDIDESTGTVTKTALTKISETLDWGDYKKTEYPPADYKDALANGVKTYFASQTFKLPDGVNFTMPERYSWVYRQSSNSQVDDLGDGNNVTLDKITKDTMNSWYDLEPLSKGNITFMPLTAEWIGAFDSNDFNYSQANTRANKEPFHGVADIGPSFYGHNIPAGQDTKGAGWYWDSKAGGKVANATIKRLSYYPMDIVYARFVNPKGGSYAYPQTDSQVFPGEGYADIRKGFGGSRGNRIFTIGRNNNYRATIPGEIIDTGDQGDGMDDGTGTGGMFQPFADGFEFRETEDEGGEGNPLTTDNHGIFAVSSHEVKLEAGFPYDGYVRHRSKDSIIGPLQTWFPEEDAADCVGIITAKAAVQTSALTMVVSTEDTRGLPPAQLTVDGDAVGQWGAASSNISSLGGSHLFARVFEAWPDSQTLFDARYFAVMHFNDGGLITEPDTEAFEFDGKEYIREAITTDVDLRIPTKKGNEAKTMDSGLIDITGWEEYPAGEKIYANTKDMAPVSLSKLTTIRRGMLLPFTYLAPTIGVHSAGIYALNNFDGKAQLGTGFEVGDTLTFTGGVGTGAQIQVLAVDPETGAILHDPVTKGENGELSAPGWKLVNPGQDYVAGDFMDSSWATENSDQRTNFKKPILTAVPDGNVAGKDAYIAATFGVTITKEVTDEGPRTSQNAPVRVTHPVPTSSKGGIGREEARGGAASLSLYGADGNATKQYDAFFHFHNDITSVLSYDKYQTAAKNVLNGNCKVQFLKMSITTK